jgi:hypothetical protein
MARADRRSSADVPAGHQRRARSPNGSDVVRSTSGSVPRLFWIRAWASPDRRRCGVMTRQAAATTGCGQGGTITPARADSQMTAHSVPSVRANVATATTKPVTRPSS